MKKLLIITCILCTTISYGQTFKTGVLGGLAVSQLDGDQLGGFNKIGLNFGGYTYVEASDRWNIQFEIQYIQKGSRSTIDIAAGQTDNILFRLDYVEIPLLARYKLGPWIVEGGLTYGQMVNFYALYATDSGRETERNDLDEFNADYDNKMNDWEFGGLIGLGYQMRDNLSFNVRFQSSIIPIKKFESGAIDPNIWTFDLGIMNRVVAMTFRFDFNT